MGQHKFNQTAIDAKNGKLPPKPQKNSKRERERLLYAKCTEIINVTIGHYISGYYMKSCRDREVGGR